MIFYTKSMKSMTTMSERGQIVIPKVLRDRLGLRPGQRLECREERGQLVAVKVVGDDPLDGVYGILKTRRGSDAAIDSMRGKPDAL